MAVPPRHPPTAPVALLALALSLALPPGARAQAPGDGAPSGNDLLTLEGRAALRDRLWGRVLTLGARPPAADLEEPSLVPWRHGQAVRVDRGRGPEVVTAATLVDGAAEIRASRGGAEAPARALGSDERTLLATVACGGPCDVAATLPPAPPASWEAGRTLFFVLPATPDVPVLGETLSVGPQPEPFDALVLVTGRAPPGTVLFDAAGLPAAVVVRGHPARTDRMLAAPLALPPPPAGEDGAAGDGAPATPAASPAAATPAAGSAAPPPAAPSAAPPSPGTGGAP